MRKPNKYVERILKKKKNRHYKKYVCLSATVSVRKNTPARSSKAKNKNKITVNKTHLTP